MVLCPSEKFKKRINEKLNIPVEKNLRIVKRWKKEKKPKRSM